MIEKNFYSIRDISKELNIPESTIRYWRNHFTYWIPCTGQGRNRRYPKDAMDVFRFIEQCRNSNMTVDGINDALSHEFPVVIDVKQGAERKPVATQQQSVLSSKSMPVLINLLEGLLERQQKIADAEQRKAVALEERSKAEVMKAGALNNIAAALEKIAAKESGFGHSIKTAVEETIASVQNDVTTKKTRADYQAADKLKNRSSDRPTDRYIETILKTIERMRDSKKFSFSDIAEKFNAEHLSTFTGESMWDQQMVMNMYQWIKGR